MARLTRREGRFASHRRASLTFDRSTSWACARPRQHSRIASDTHLSTHHGPQGKVFQIHRGRSGAPVTKNASPTTHVSYPCDWAPIHDDMAAPNPARPPPPPPDGPPPPRARPGQPPPPPYPPPPRAASPAIPERPEPLERARSEEAGGGLLKKAASLWSRAAEMVDAAIKRQNAPDQLPPPHPQHHHQQHQQQHAQPAQG
jgi:hypothetical protein